MLVVIVNINTFFLHSTHHVCLLVDFLCCLPHYIVGDTGHVRSVTVYQPGGIVDKNAQCV